MRIVAVLVVAFACSGAFASEPGQPLDCSDWIILEPGLQCAPFTVVGAAEPRFYNRGTSRVIDNSGRLLIVQRRLLSNSGGTPIYRTEILALNGNEQSVLAYIDDRPAAGDRIRPTDEPSFSGTGTDIGGALTFDAINGRLVVTLWRTSNCCLDWGLLAQFDGFARTFDVLQTYTPPGTLALRVPAMPEGFPAAEHFDTYWGNLTHPMDFTQAHPLHCGYPAATPHVGDYLTVADTVPTPPPGQGVYYVTAASYQGARRYGRKTTAGQLTGRDPAVLPVCGH